MVKIALVSHEMTYSGAPHSLLNIANLLRVNGVKVFVYTLVQGRFEREFKHNKLYVKKVPENYRTNADFISEIKGYDYILANTIFCMDFAVFAQSYVPTVLYIREAQNLPDIIRDCHLNSTSLAKINSAVCVSEYASKAILSQYALNKLNVIHNFIPDTYSGAFNTTLDGKVHFMVSGTIEKRKGFDVAVRAFISLDEKYQSKSVLHLAGATPKWAKSYWKDILGFQCKNIIYHGYIGNEQKKQELYEKMNVFVVPSLDESCSIVALEGMMLSKPVIVTENVGAKYLINDTNGTVIKTSDENALRSAFEYYIQNADSLSEYGKSARTTYLKLGTADGYFNSLEAVLKNIPPPNSDDNEARISSNISVCSTKNKLLKKQYSKEPTALLFSNKTEQAVSPTNIPEKKEMFMKERIKVDKINVCFIADSDYVIPTSVAITSLCMNANKKYMYNIYVVMPQDVNVTSTNLILANADDFDNINIEIVKRDIGQLALLHKGNDQTYLAATSTALFKFELADIFSDLDKILYLDGDIIIKDNLIDLYNTDISDYYVGAVRDLPQVLYPNQPLGKEISGKDYFNSGVMLLNLNRMRAENIKEKLIETKRNYADQSLMDQSIFNVVFKSSVLQLPFIYNCCYINLIESKNRYDMDKLNSLYSTSYNNVYEIMPDIKIMHFSSKLKPWYFYDVALADEWIYYYKHSSLKRQRLQRIFHNTRNVDMCSAKQTVKQLSELKQYGYKRIIPVVMAANEEYLPYAIVAIQSIYENSNSEYFYDINIFVDATMSANMKNRISHIKYENVKITLWDARNSFNEINLYSVGHYSRQMYYRWLIPEILTNYDKVLYLDCDIVVNTDISKLYDIEIGDNYVAAANNFLRNNLYNYVTNKLNLNAEQYYNSGVLIINSKAWIENNLKNRCIDYLKSMDKLACPDQDTINVVCYNKILRLDDMWNFQWHHQFPDARKGIFLLDYKERYDAILETEPYIVHYTSFIKPWSFPERTFAEFFWRYCRKSDFYEAILFNNLKDCKNGSADNASNVKKQQLSSLLHKINEIKNSFTYKLARAIGWLPRKLKGYDFTPLADSKKSIDEQIISANKLIDEIYASRSVKIALKITALPRKLRKKSHRTGE